MKKSTKVGIVVIGLLCLLWGSVVAVLASKYGTNEMLNAGTAVVPCKAILAAGIVGTAGITIYLIRNRKRCSVS